MIEIWHRNGSLEASVLPLPFDDFVLRDTNAPALALGFRESNTLPVKFANRAGFRHYR